MIFDLKRLLAYLGVSDRGEPPGASPDPYSWRPVPRKPQPKPQRGAVAVAEPDE
jgi:hypothetical protein